MSLKVEAIDWLVLQISKISHTLPPPVKFRGKVGKCLSELIKLDQGSNLMIYTFAGSPLHNILNSVHSRLTSDGLTNDSPLFAVHICYGYTPHVFSDVYWISSKRSIPYMKTFSTLCRSKTVFWISAQLDIFCTSAVKWYYSIDDNSAST